MEEEKEEEEEEEVEPKMSKQGFLKLEKRSESEAVVIRLAALAVSFNVRLKSSDMPVHMQEHALRYARSLLISGSHKPTHTHLATALKKEFDSEYGLAWHCVIGTSYGSYVSHTGGGFLYFSIDSLSVLLFKTEVHLVTQPPPPPPP